MILATVNIEQKQAWIPTTEPAAFSAQFAREKQSQWMAFMKTSTITDAPNQLETVLARLREFILPIFQALCAKQTFVKKWAAGGPWSV